MEELKKCPFCGGEAAFRTKGKLSSNHFVGISFEIECRDCRAKLPKEYRVEFSLAGSGDINPLHDERKQAADDWNKRYGC